MFCALLLLLMASFWWEEMRTLNNFFVCKLFLVVDKDCGDSGSLRAGSLVGIVQRSWREEWGEEKWACTRAIDFWIPRVRWGTQRSDWLKLTDYRNQCKFTAFHVMRTVARLCSRSGLKLSINSDLNFELKLEQKIAVNCLLEGRDVFAVMPSGFGKRLFSAVLHNDRTEEDLRRRVPERCDSSDIFTRW